MSDTEQREKFFDRMRVDLERLQSDQEAWADYQAEIRSMDGTLADGLTENPWDENGDEDHISDSTGT